LAAPPVALLALWAIDCIPDGVAIFARGDDDGEDRCMFVNPAFAELVGCSIADLLGKSLSCDAVPDIDDAVWRFLVESHSDAHPTSVKILAGEIAGERRVLRLMWTRIGDPSGQPRGRAAFLRDITAAKKTEGTVWRNERLVGIGLLATSIVHEINNPLGSALLAAETALAIADSVETDNQIKACLNNIAASADRCGQIVQTLLRYSRDEPPKKQCCSVNDVAKQAMDMTRSYAEGRGVAVRMERDPETPIAPMNPLEIEMVLGNLIRNAIEASSRDTEVLVRTGWTNDAVWLSVSDHGCGMTNEQITRMFDPLYTTRKNAGGSGLGLGIASGIVQRHGGCMEVQSVPGAGTTIVVHLPMATAPSSEGNQSRAGCHGANSDCRGRETSR
jgi:PAS domain S-box-containing protein